MYHEYLLPCSQKPAKTESLCNISWRARFIIKVRGCYPPAQTPSWRPLYPVERTPGTHWLGGRVDPRAGLGEVKKAKFLTLPGLVPRPLCRPDRSQSLFRLRYPGSYLVINDNNFQYGCTWYWLSPRVIIRSCVLACRRVNIPRNRY
jgi:hypothetical protein